MRSIDRRENLAAAAVLSKLPTKNANKSSRLQIWINFYLKSLCSNVSNEKYATVDQLTIQWYRHIIIIAINSMVSVATTIYRKYRVLWTNIAYIIFRHVWHWTSCVTTANFIRFQRSGFLRWTNWIFIPCQSTHYDSIRHSLLSYESLRHIYTYTHCTHVFMHQISQVQQANKTEQWISNKNEWSSKSVIEWPNLICM